MEVTRERVKEYSARPPRRQDSPGPGEGAAVRAGSQDAVSGKRF